MAPEHEARVRVLYDHENDEPRRRHAVADWGVAEDIFDRMPSRRFTRADRRVEHAAGRRFERTEAAEAPLVAGESRTIVIERAAPPEYEAEAAPRAAAAAPAPTWPGRRAAIAEAGLLAPRDPAGAEAERVASRDGVGADAGWVAPDDRAVADAEWAPRRAGFAEVEPAMPPPGRRTVVISGHPENLPAARPPRPPRTAIERVGASPDRIVAYAVALGFLLVLIAVLTTGQ